MNRQPKGIPVGGQFAEGRNPVGPDLALYTAPTTPVDENVALLRERREALIAGMSLRATAIPAQDAPTVAGRSKDVGKWWERKFAEGEFSQGDDSGFMKMPDDYTPSMTSGNSTTDHRRTHRMNYVGAGVSMRMPSHTSINRFADEHPGETFDVPLVAEYPGGSIEGWVRVAKSANGTWRSKGLGFTPEQTSYVDEAVLCVLEARRPSMALSRVSSLVESRRERFARQGTQIPNLAASSWIKGLGYDHATDTMVMETESGKSYGYNVGIDTYRAVAFSASPGTVFNKFKNRMDRVSVSKCDTCKRHYVKSPHKCPPNMSAPRTDDEIRTSSRRMRRYLSRNQNI